MRVGLCLLGLVVLLLAGCSTVQSRIEQNRALFEGLDPATQQTLLNGQTQVGYSMQLTHIALGSPDRVERRQSADGDVVTWVYIHSYPVHRRGVHFHHGHRSHGSRYLLPDHYVYREYLRVEFVSGLVASIESLE